MQETTVPQSDATIPRPGCVLLLVDVYSRIPGTPSSQQPQTLPEPALQQGRGADADASASAVGNASLAPAETLSAGTLPSSGPGERTATGVPPPSAADTPGVSPRSTAPGASAEAQSSMAAPTPPATSAAEDTGDRVSMGQAQLKTGQIVDLGGIAWSESDPYALINGQVVGVGELVRSYRVISITPNEVILEKDQDRVILRLE